MSFTKRSRKPVGQILENSASHLNKLIVKARYIESLQTLIDANLDPMLAKHCQVANFREGKLTLLVDTQSHAHLIRFCLPELKNTLIKKQALRELTGIKVKVTQKDYVRPAKQIAAQVLSTDNAELLQKTSETISHTRLAKVLARISRN